jgi:hypothetical protein
MRTWAWVVVAPWLLACGSTEGTPSDAGTDVDASKLKPKDAGIEAAAYVPQGVRCVRDDDAGSPAPWTPPDAGDGGVEGGANDGGIELPRAAQVVSPDGVVANLPVIVPITFDGDYARNEIEDFTASVGCTPYWRAIANEYGIGDAVSATPIHLSEAAPATISDGQIRTWLQKKIATDPAFPKPSVNVVYAIFYPDGTEVTAFGGKSCSSFGGYHGATSVGGKSAPYAVMPRCGASIDQLTSVTSHELIEYATDPIPPSGYGSVGDIDAAWAVFGGSEVGDMCQYGFDSTFTPAGYPFAVQRSWSNRAAWLHDDPCQPAAGVYFVAAPVVTDMVPMNFGGFATMARGVKVPVGQTRTIDVVMMANGSTSDWNVTASDLSPSLGGGPTVKLTLDASTGNAGKVLKLTIQRTGTNGSTGAAPFLLRSQQKNGQSHSWFAVAGD